MSTIVGDSVRTYPISTGKQMLVLAILVRRIEGTFKAYAGIIEDTSTEEPDYRKRNAEWITHQGTPLRYEEAKLHWPSLVDKEYAA